VDSSLQEQGEFKMSNPDLRGGLPATTTTDAKTIVTTTEQTLIPAEEDHPRHAWNVLNKDWCLQTATNRF